MHDDEQDGTSCLQCQGETFNKTGLCALCQINGYRIREGRPVFVEVCKACDGTGRRTVHERLGGTGVEYRTQETCQECATD